MPHRFFPGVLPLKATSQLSSLSLRATGVPSFRVTPGKKSLNAPNEPKKDLGHPPWVIFNTILLFLLSQVLVAPLLVYAVHGIIRPHQSLNFDNSIVAQFFFILIAELFVLLAVIRIVKRRGLSLQVIGLGRRPVWADLWRAGLGFVVFYIILIGAGTMINALSPNLNNQQQNLGFSNINGGFENFLAFVALVILPPLGEETLVRGYLYSGLRFFWRFWPAVLFTSLFFGAAHLEFSNGGPLVWAAAVDTFLLSVVLCFLRERTGALYAGMLVHMLNNLIAFGVHFK